MNKKQLLALAKKSGCEVIFTQGLIGTAHRSSLWYGGHMASVRFPNGVCGDISADGDVNATLLDKDLKEEIAEVRDKWHMGKFYVAMMEYIHSDEELLKLEKSGRLVFENNNWYEITARDPEGNFIDLGWCADDDLYEAIAECIEGMPCQEGYKDAFREKKAK